VYVAKLFALYRWLGRLDELREEVEELERDGSIAHSAWLAALSLHRVLVGDRREGLASARRLVSGLERVPRDFFWLSTTTVIAEAIAVCRDEESAPALYEALSPYADRFTTHSFGASWGSVQRTLGLLADVMGHEHRATQHLRLALAANTAIKAPVLVTITKCDYGELLARTGHLEPARELGEEAERAAQEHGLPVLEERAARLAGLPHTRSIGARN